VNAKNWPFSTSLAGTVTKESRLKENQNKLGTLPKGKVHFKQ